jgi:O-antigen/teichoic acid export membrane protein
VNLKLILRNVFSNWTGYVLAMVVMFFLTPFIVHSLGNNTYGVWTLVVSLTGYFGMLDLGVRSTVGRYVARYVGLCDPVNVNRTISSAFIILGSSGLVALVGVLVTSLMLGKFHIDSQMQPAARTALLLAGINICVGLPLGVFSALITALERFDIVNSVGVAGWLVRAALILIFLKLGYGLVALASITVSVGMLEYAAIIFFAMRLYPSLRLSWRSVDRGMCRELGSFGVFRFIWIIANQLIFYTDDLVIGAFLNAGAITYFTIGGSLINYGRNIVCRVTDTLGPSAAGMDARRDIKGLQKLLIVGTQITLLITLPLCLGFVFLGKQFIGLWMGKSYATSVTVLMVLTIPQVCSMPQYVSSMILTSMAKHRVLAYVSLANGFANLALSIFLVRKIGLIGVAWGTVVPELISAGLIIPVYMLHMVSLNAGEFFRRAYLRPLLSAIPIVALGYGFAVGVESPSWLGFGAEVVAMCGVFGIMSFFLCFDAAQRSMAFTRIWGILHREPVVNEV